MKQLAQESGASRDSQAYRRHWPVHLRTYAVLKEEGVPGIFRRLQKRAAESYRRFVPGNPSEVYDESFFEVSRNANSFAEVFAEWLIHVFEPSAVLDVGCGDCSLLTALCRRGVNAYGLDGSAAAVRSAPNGIFVFQADLRQPFLLNKRFPIVCCIEVAEHLPKRAARVLTSCLVEHAQDAIVFSAAHPGQRGVGHINEQPGEYWIDLFAQYDWIPDNPWTQEAKAVLQVARVPEFLLRNLIVLRPCP